MDVPGEVSELLDALVAGARETLGDGLVGVYLRGSLASDDFVPETSDVDVLAATERPVHGAQFAALQALHARLAESPVPFGRRHEVAYIDRASLQRFSRGQRHPTLGQGETLQWTEHRDNWVLERWTVREHGVVLVGPEPSLLIDAISSDELRAAVRARLPDWADWLDDSDDPGWREPRRNALAYAVETMCRCHYLLATGELASKPTAVSWALANLPREWRATIERSRAWRADRAVDHAIVPEVQRFIRWATERGDSTGRTR